MGHVLSTSNQPSQQQSSQLKLNIETNREVKTDLMPLLNWSLSQIRQIYAPFRRRKGSPILTRSQFLRFINLSRISSFFIYDQITKNDKVNVFQILAILVLGSYTGYIYKLQFLFNIFDFRCKKRLNFVELTLLFKSIVRGFCFLTDQPLPENSLLQKFGLTLFSKADLNNDQELQIGQIVGWLETASQNLVFFKLFEPPSFGKEQYHIFNSFVAYSGQQITVILNRLQKLYTKQKIQQQDLLLLKPIIKSKKDDSAKTINNSNIKRNFSQTWNSKGNTNQRKGSNQKQNRGLNLKKNSSININVNSNFNSKVFEDSNNNSFLPLITSNTSKYHQKKKFENIIIIKGRTITKKQVFQLRQYFDNMSIGKRHILIEDFIENFNQEKYNHMKSVAASLFNFLDKHQNGKIEFLDLVTKLYPNLSPKHIEIISQWSQQYNRNFNMDKKIKATRDNDEYKKRVLPKTCIIRMQELFKFFDQKNKGYVDIDDLKRVLSGACNEKEIKDLFTSSDTDADGKLTLKQFVHVLLPSDLEIQGLG